MKKRLTVILLVLLACSVGVRAEAPVRAVATLVPTKGSTVSGTIRFTQEGNRIHIVADVSGLTPGSHGFHVHEFGDITAEDGTSAGGHYNPMKMPHSAPTAEMRHEGDLGNLVADQSGHAHLDVYDHCLKLAGPDSIVGRGVVVHANPDDLTTQPTGNAGARVAVGVIGLAGPEKKH